MINGQGAGRHPGRGAVWLPEALSRKMPTAARQLAWQFVFPASAPFVHEKTGETFQHHVHETSVQDAVREAARFRHLQQEAIPR